MATAAIWLEERIRWERRTIAVYVVGLVLAETSRLVVVPAGIRIGELYCQDPVAWRTRCSGRKLRLWLADGWTCGRGFQHREMQTRITWFRRLLIAKIHRKAKHCGGAKDVPSRMRPGDLWRSQSALLTEDVARVSEVPKDHRNEENHHSCPKQQNAGFVCGDVTEIQRNNLGKKSPADINSKEKIGRKGVG